MNKQRVVIYEQRRAVLEGQDLSDEVKEWVREVVERVVDQVASAEASEGWDLEALVQGMQAMYGSDITVEELREEVELEREALIEEFVEDALEVYGDKEEQFGVNPETEQPLMRDLERFVILQVVDTRWREHLENMEYLREGVHLRAMAQKDPLVEYTSEGHGMFEELNAAIREEVVVTLFHAEIEPAEAAELQEYQERQAAGDGGLSYEHQSLAGADAIMAAGASETVATATPIGSNGGSVSTGQRVVSEHEKLGRNDPCWCGSGKKFKKCHGA
jgi:preprotein translocase subunit SecA